ncbi:MAG: hypothetical protein KF784_08465 [Fimbriimonadaceae bacterium]|nr:hypothetical protein [Fimbriimonadaceae bacterium]
MRRSIRAIALGTIWVAPILVSAQVPFDAGTTPENSANDLAVGGRLTSDLILIKSSTPTIPLRYGSIVANSERIELGGRELVRGKDYSIDLESGVVYLMVPVKNGQSMVATYRYRPDAQKELSGLFSTGGAPTFKFDLMPGGVKALVGFGMTERGKDGNVISSNVYGLNNAFKFGGAGKLGGLMLFASREENSVESNYEYREKKKAEDLGSSSFMHQQLETKMLGGNVVLSYQDISKNFTAFSAVADAGYDQKTVDQLKKERGLERMSMGIQDMNLGSSKFSGGFKTVGDGDNSIEWRNYGFKSGGLQLNYNSQTVDKGFNRFKDLAEADRAQLQKEAGMSRQTMSGQFAQKTSKVSFEMNQVSDPNEKEIVRRSLSLDTTGFKLWIGDQEVESGFSRMSSLLAPEQGMYGREIGLSRQWFGMETGLLGKNMLVRFEQKFITSKSGDFKSEDVSFKGNGWSLEHATRDVSAGFTNLNSMQDAEKKDHAQVVANMYDPKGVALQGDDINRFLGTRGLSRSLTRFNAEPFKAWKFSFDALKLEGAKDEASVDTYDVQGPGFKAKYRKQNLGAQFNELASLMNVERQRLGTLQGLDRTDFALAFDFNKKSNFSFSNMSAESANSGGASRTSLQYNDPNLSVQLNARNVDPQFDGVNRLVDPEKDLLKTMQGFQQRDARIVWRLMPGLKLDSFVYESNNGMTEEARLIQNTRVDWALDKNTAFTFQTAGTKNADPLKTLFESNLQQFAVSRTMGSGGKFTYLHETQDFNGVDANRPDYDKHYFAYEAKLNQKTSLRTEQTRTRFDNGDKENVSTNVVTTEIAKNAGVSVTDTHIDREGDERDETRRLYGFYFDLPNGMRISYGYNRQMNGANGALQSTLGVTAGQIGGISVDQANYNTNSVDGQYNNATSNFQISTKKPLTLGFLHNFQISAGSDTQSQKSNWVKENKQLAVGFNIGSTAFGYAYRSQMHQSGYRAIDRAFSFKTDQNENRVFRAAIDYKIRTLPWGENVMIRNFGVYLKPAKDITLSNVVSTNPEDKANPNQLLGSVATKRQDNQWKLEWKRDQNFTLSGQWLEQQNYSEALVRHAGLNLTLFQGSGSPLTLYYGMRQSGWDDRKTSQEFSLRFDQRPGPNQVFSFYVGNVSYQNFTPNGYKNTNWTVRLDYQLRLK